jgi:hypothetical protein
LSWPNVLELDAPTLSERARAIVDFWDRQSAGKIAIAVPQHREGTARELKGCRDLSGDLLGNLFDQARNARIRGGASLESGIACERRT